MSREWADERIENYYRCCCSNILDWRGPMGGAEFQEKMNYGDG